MMADDAHSEVAPPPASHDDDRVGAAGEPSPTEVPTRRSSPASEGNPVGRGEGSLVGEPLGRKA